MRFGMKLMGTPKLRTLARRGPDDLSGPVGALCAELADANWTCPADLVAQFPTAQVAGANVRIAVSDPHFVNLVVNYGAGIVLISATGTQAELAAMEVPKGSEAA